MKRILTFAFIICITLCNSQNNITEKNDGKESLYKQIIKLKKKFELTVYPNGVGKYDYQSELEAEFCGKQEGQDGTAIYFKLVEETNRNYSIPINYKRFKSSLKFQYFLDGQGKKFKIKDRIKKKPRLMVLFIYGWIRLSHYKFMKINYFNTI